MTTSIEVSPLARLRVWIERVFSGKGIFVVLAVILLIAVFVAPNLFAPVNVGNTLRRAAILGLITIGQMLVLMVRNVDLSVAAIVGITAVAATTAPDPLVGLGIAVVIAVATGAVNSWLVVSRGVPSFVATFGMVMVLEGAKLIWTKGALSAQAPESVISLARGWIGPVPVPVVFWIIVTVLATLWVSRTRSGRNLVLTGANPRMARLSGISTGTMQWIAFTAAAVLAAFAGFLQTGYSGYVDRSIGAGMELDSITAALLGGARFRGGEGSFVSAVGGVLVLSTLSTLIVVLGLPPELQNIIKGAVLVLALILHWPARR
ncbi:ABC transporter permease [Leifsonia sp. H3M29-4]|uniref:ABC transporter permease n=1 Tax=Salinibacterium metalliresistens TaxID=3031321 RepID=UPI0023DA34F6|nr:ABC transporter permease [Salinibacterium metalliresistens]MDF1480178.1 ABC transporter permease [Salinibacterium metalliresistens]